MQDTLLLQTINGKLYTLHRLILLLSAGDFE